jgi:branched-chain amino acid transport system substrate-binding protein
MRRVEGVIWSERLIRAVGVLRRDVEMGLKSTFVVSASIGAVLAAAALGAFVASPASGQPGDPITIALEAPLSGPQASNGRDMLRGVQLAVRQANQRGGVVGRTIEILRLDDKANPSLAKGAADRAIAAGAVAVIGPYNSSVGLVNLPVYVAGKVVPIHLTSTDETAGKGLTIQPKNSQISPVEARYFAAQRATRVSMLVDPSAYTKGMADRLRRALERRGVAVTTVPIVAGRTDYGAEVATALDADPELVYASTYYPEGSKIARSLLAATGGGSSFGCFMGLANVDPAFVAAAGVEASRLCRYSGVPTAAQIPTAARYVRQYRAAFRTSPGVWGTFTYDSTNVLLDAIRRTRSLEYGVLMRTLLRTRGYRGATGAITIDPSTGNRTNVPVYILSVSRAGKFVVSR